MGLLACKVARETKFWTYLQLELVNPDISRPSKDQDFSEEPGAHECIKWLKLTPGSSRLTPQVLNAAGEEPF